MPRPPSHDRAEEKSERKPRTRASKPNPKKDKKGKKDKQHGADNTKGRKPAPKPHRKGKSAPRTTCLVCGEGSTAGRELIRIVHVDGTGWVADERKRLTGSAFDVHCAARCVGGLSGREVEPPISVETLRATLRAWLEGGVLDALSRVAAAGQLIGGHDVLQDAFARGEVHTVLVASDAAPRTLRSLQKGAPESVTFYPLSVDNEALAARVGKATLAAAGVPDTPAAAPLLRRLAMLNVLEHDPEA